MDCPGCGGTNRDGARFCIGCGAALALRCVSCGNELPPAARFCDGCGSAVTSEPAAEPVAAARKVVTVVFADMTGSTALEEGMDAEAVRTLLDRIYAGLRKDVEDHGGRVVKFTGDGLMAAFGVPEVGEDDADRAVAAATTMLETMAAIASETGQPIALKAGINTGEVVVIEEDDDVVGDAVNVASRLEGAAVSGEILVGEATWRLTRASSSYEAIEPLVVKGKSEPVPAYRLVAVAEGGEETLTPPFVGRTDELARLLEVFEEAVEAKAARLVTIVGSPGLGKTRLAHELAAGLADRAVVRESRCDPAGSATFAPIAETIRASASISEAATEEEILEALKAMLPEDDPDRDRIAGYVGAVLGVGKPGSTEQTFWALRKLIETRAAADLPRVLILDDLHWAEPLLLDFVEHIAEWIRAAPVLLVGTGRPELRDMRPSLAEGGRAAAVIALEGLDPGATEELAMGLLGTQHVPTELIARIPASTEGNPLFVRELVRMLVDDGVLRREGDAWRLTVDVEAVEVPPTIQSLLAARMDRLEVDERTVLELASVVGKEFYRGAVAELATTGVRDGLEGCLERLRRKELVEPVGTYWIDEPVYRFHHALIRDAAYRRLLKETRAELHERVASWLEGKTSGLVGEHEEAIGYHLEQAHEYKRQLGREDYELGSRAAGLLRTAAERALDRDDLPGAAALAGRALERLPDFEADARSELLLMRCEALLSMGDVTHAGPAVEEFLELAHESRLAAWGTCFQGHLANLTSGGLEETEASVAEAAEQLTELGDMAGAAKAHTVRATALAGLGRFGECEAALDEALTAARQAEGRRRSVTATLGTAPQAQVWGPNPVSRAGGRCLDLVRLLRITTGSLAVEQTSMRCQAVLEAFRGRTDAARVMLRRARNKLTELGLEHELLETEQFAGFVEVVSGNAAEALPALKAAHEGFTRLGSHVLAAQTAALLARAHLVLGELEEAEVLVSSAEGLATRDVKTAIAWRAVRAEILSRRGRFEEAKALAEEAVRLGEPTDALFDHGMAYRQLARVLRAAGDAAGAQRADERALALFERKGATALMGEQAGRAETQAAAKTETVPDEAPSAARPAELDNAAVRASLTFVDTLFAKRDLAAFEALLTEDFAIDDRRRALIAASSTGREAAVEEAKSVLGIGTSHMERTPIATRGERLCLLRDLALGKDVGSEAFGVEFLSIVELDESGLLTRWTRFEPDDLDAAMAELDECFIAGEGAPHAVVARLWVDFVTAYNDRDWTAFRALFRDDMPFVDHRPLSLGEIHDPDEYVHALEQLVELIPGRRCHLTGFPALRSDSGLCSLHIPGITPDGGETEDSMHLLGVVTGDRFERIEHFPVDRLDAALARFEQLGGSAPQAGDVPENDAVRAALLMYEAFERQDWDAFGALHRPDGTTEDRRPGLGSRGSGRDHMVEIGRTTKSVGPRTARWSTIAVRGSRLAVGRVAFRAGPDDFEVDVLQLFETDDEGLVRHWATWEPDDIDAALAELDARFLAGEGAPYADVVRLTLQTSRATSERDWNAYRAAFADDLIFVDHRPVSLGEIHGADGLVEAIRVMYDLVEESRAILVAVHALSDRGGVAESVTRGVSKAGGEFEVANLMVGLVEDGRFVRLEFFPPEQRHAALARFEELTAAEAGPLENACVRVVRRGLELLGERDWDRAAEIYREDVVGEDRRHLSPLMATGRAEALEHVKGIADVVHLFTVTPIATRGERLALVRMELREDHGRGVTFPLSWIQVDEIDEDGRLRAFVSFEVEDLDAAFAELDERFIAGEGAPFADVVETNATVVALWNARDFQAATTHIDPDFVLVDHRPLGFGTVEGVEPFMEVANSLAEVAPDARRYFSRYHALADGVALVEQVSRASPDTDADEIVYQLVVCVEDGRWKRGEIFPEDDLDAALARFEELTRAGGRGTVLENAATRLMARHFDALRRRDWDAMRSLVVDDLVREDARSGLRDRLVGAESYVEEMRAFMDLGFVPEHEILATRGDRSCLVRFTGVTPEGNEVQGLSVVEVGDDGRMTGGIRLDPDDLDAAFAELDERFAAGEGAPFADEFLVTSQLVRAVNARDWSAVRAGLTDDYVLSDRRPASFGDLTADQWVDSLRALADIAPDSAVYSVALLAMDRGRVWALNRVSASRSDLTDTYSLLNMVAQLRDGKLARGWVFPPEDLGAARACYESLVASAPSGPPENSAARTLHRFDDTLLRSDWDAMREVLRPDAVMDDRRPVMAARLEGADAILENFHAVAAVGVLRSEPATIAVRAERLALCRVRVFHDATDDPFVNESLVVVEVDEEGRVRSFTLFEPDDLDAAIHELDERYLAGEGAPFAEGWRLTMEALEGHNARDWARVRAALADDFVMEDHRPMAFVVSSADEMVEEIYKGAVQLIPDRHIIAAWIEAIDTDHVLMRQVLRGTTVEGAEVEHDLWVVGKVRDGVCARTWIYSPEDRDAALARYEELTASAPPGPPENECLRVFLRAFERYKAGDLDGALANLAEDFVAEDRRHLAPITALGREEMLEQLRSGEHIVDLLTVTPLCAFGERLALVRMEFREDHSRLPFGTSYLQVEEIDEAGLHMASVTFEEDDLDAAMDELDRRFIAGEGAPYARELELVSRYARAVNARDWAGARACMTADGMVSDHRPVSFGEITADQYVESLKALGDLVPNFRVGFTSYLDLSGDAMLGRLHIWNSPSETSVPHSVTNVVIRLRDGKVTRVDAFAPEDIDAARACFEGYSAPDPSAPAENACSRAVRSYSERFEARDWDGMDALLSEDFVIDDLRPVVGVLQGPMVGREAARAFVENLVRYGVLRRELRLLATRGERLSLMHVIHRGVNPDDPEGPWETVILQVTELDEAGLIQACVAFEEDDLDTAFAELDQRFARGEGAEAAEFVLFGVPQAISDGDWQRLRELVADDIVLIDHRPVSLGEVRGGDAWVETIRTLSGLAGEFRADVIAYHVWESDGAVTEVKNHGVTEDGGAFEMSFLTVSRIRNGRLACIEYFPTDQLDEALARFVELGAEDQASSAIPETVATKTRRLLMDAFNRRDFDESARLLTEDFVFEDRRAGLKHTIAGRDGMLENMAVIISLGDISNVVVPLAARGELLALHRLVFTGDQDFEVEMLEVNSFDDQGRVTSSVTFDSHDVDGAFAELDERFVAGEGADHADVIRLHSAWVSAWNDRDWTRLASSFVPDYVVIDHRPMSFGTTSTVEEFVEATRTMTEVAPGLRMRIVCYHRLDEGIGLVELLISGEAEHGGEVELPICGVVRHEGGRFTSTEIFAMDDFDRALARYEELRAAPSQLANACSQANDRLTASFAARDWGAVAEAFAPDAYVEDRRPVLRNVVEGREAIVANLRELAEVGGAAWEEELLATRGERLVLYRRSLVGPADRDIDVRILDLSGIDEHGRIAFGIHFEADDLDTAFAELDGRYMSGEAAPFADAVMATSEYVAAWNARDWERLAATCASDFVIVDHRTMGWGSTEGVRDTDALIEATRTLAEVAPDLRRSVSRFHALGEGIVAGEFSVIGEAPHGGEVELSLHAVALHEARRFTRFELFDGDDLGGALARYEELRAERTEPSELSNAATELLHRANDAFNRGDSDAFSSLLAEDSVHEDRRKGIGHVLTGRDKLVENFEAIHALGSATRSFTPIAVRGDRLVLSRTRYADTDGLVEAEMLRINYLDDQGLFGGSIDFDLDDEDAAFAELDERFTAGEGDPFVDEVRLLSEFVAAWNARDWDRVVATSRPDLVVVDHRPMGWGRLESVDAFVEATRVLTEMAPDLRMSIARFHALDRGILAAALPITGPAQHGGQVELGAHIVVGVRAGRAHHVELFDAEDLDGMLARYEELRSDRASPGLENLAVEATERWDHAFNRRDAEALSRLFAENVVSVDRRKGLQHTLTGRAEMVRNTEEWWRIGAVVRSFPIAIRGERLALTRNAATGRDPATSFSGEKLQVICVDESGMVVECIDFDPDDLDAAFTELDERFLVGEGAPYADVLRHSAAQLAAAASGDWEAWRGLVADEVVLFDHRQVSLGEVRGVEDVLEASRTLVELVRYARPRTVAYHAMADDRVLKEVRISGTADHGGEVEASYLRLQQFRDGRVVRIELFPLEDLDSARTRFTELTPGS